MTARQRPRQPASGGGAAAAGPPHPPTTTALEDLVTGAEAARRLRLSRERLRQLAQRADFPRPLGRLGQALVWRWDDVAQWTRAHRPAAAIELASEGYCFRTIPSEHGFIEIEGPRGERASAVAWPGSPIIALEPAPGGVRVVTSTRSGEIRRNAKGYWTLQSAIHTAPKNGGWVNQVAGGGPTLSRHRTQDAAVRVARARARASGADHVVHDTNGRIIARNNYGSVRAAARLRSEGGRSGP